jgi:hypothetical protein
MKFSLFKFIPKINQKIFFLKSLTYPGYLILRVFFLVFFVPLIFTFVIRINSTKVLFCYYFCILSISTRQRSAFFYIFYRYIFLSTLPRLEFSLLFSNLLPVLRLQKNEKKFQKMTSVLIIRIINVKFKGLRGQKNFKKTQFFLIFWVPRINQKF